MLFRAIALTLALLIGMGTIIPLGTDSAEAGQRTAKKKYEKKKRYRYRKYSKRWWRQYRARMKRKRALQARRRALRLRRLRLARKNRRRYRVRRRPVIAKQKVTVDKADKVDNSVALLPSGKAAPNGWRRAASSSSEVSFSVDNGNGSAAISVVGPATGETVDSGRHRTVGGVPTTALRREVINRMIRENGWVVNDYQKSIGGRSVYVVVAQSQNGSRVQSRMFYFTEADGRIYSVATNSAAEAADRIAEESEKVIFSLQTPRPVQQALVRED
jgi:hypothetical protein